MSRYFRIKCLMRFSVYSLLCMLFLLVLETEIYAQKSERVFRIMEYNVENLFDAEHDSLKQDYDFLPEGSYQWTKGKYWRKLNAVARGIILASTVKRNDGSDADVLQIPDIVGLCEVENDSVMTHLVRRSLLRGAGYEYLMTSSPDERGVDVALLYQPVSFRPLSSESLRVDTLPGMKPTRDILYVKGETLDGMLHVYVVHAPSRSGGEGMTRHFRTAVVRRLCQSVDSVMTADSDACVVVMGDFNDYTGDESLLYMSKHQLCDITAHGYIKESKRIGGTYRYRGDWGSLDHIFVSPAMLRRFVSSEIASHPELVEEDEKYGGVKPYRFFRGPTIHGGFSDHLPLMAVFSLGD